jgi:hypothetical protein
VFSIVRRVGLVVSTSDSRSGVAGSAPDEGATYQMRIILELGVYSPVAQANQAFHRSGSINSYRLRLVVEVLRAATGTMAG